MAKLEVGDKVIITEGDFKGERGAITDKTLIGDGITVALEDGRQGDQDPRGAVNLVEDD